MSERFTIEDQEGETAGLIVRQAGERGYRFHSCEAAYTAIDGRRFATPEAAQRAVIDLTRVKARYRVNDRLSWEMRT